MVAGAEGTVVVHRLSGERIRCYYSDGLVDFLVGLGVICDLGCISFLRKRVRMSKDQLNARDWEASRAWEPCMRSVMKGGAYLLSY